MGKDKEVLTKLYEESLKDIKEGEVIKGKIVKITPKEVLVDIGYKSEGLILRSEFNQHEELKLGQEIDVYVENKEDEQGVTIVSYEKAKKLRGWEGITKNYKEGILVDGRVIKKIKGGYIVDVCGVESFLPKSLSGFKGVLEKDLFKNIYKFAVLKLNTQRRSLIVSRKDALQKEKQDLKNKIWDDLSVGQTRQGTVKGITDFGAFIDLGGVDGLLHIGDMSWSRISHPSEVVAVGDKIDVVILNLDPEQQKVSLGLKQKTPDPWENIEQRYSPQTKVKGKVVNILPYGIFVELEKGIEGLIHISEISWQKRINNLNDLFAIGDMVEVQVLSIDKEARRIALSIKQLESNPWVEAENKFPPGTKVSGRVMDFTEYGAFVEIASNLEGMIHLSDFSWTRRPNHPQDVLKRGQKIDVVVISVDSKARRISLGLKQLIPNPWPDIAKRFPVGQICDADVVSITDFGIFVKLEDDLEGLIYASEIDKAQSQSLKAGDKIRVKIIKVDVEQMKIGLSAKI